MSVALDEGVTFIDDGRRRRRLAAIVVAVAVGCAGGGVLFGRQLKSPADAAADRAQPAASRLTALVEQRELTSSLTLAGEIHFTDPTVLKLSGSVGLGEGETAVLTRVPAVGQQIAEGDVVFDVSGRPVIALVGSSPMYRSLGPGSTGQDVLQLEQALERSGFAPGSVDTIYDAATGAAVDAIYQKIGYTSIAASTAEIEQLRTLRLAVTAADASVRAANQALADAKKGPTGATLLQLQQQVALTTDQLPVTQGKADRDNSSALLRVQTAQARVASAINQRDIARAARATATAPGAIDPATGAPYTTDEIDSRSTALALAEQAVIDTQTSFAEAVDNQADVGEQGNTSVVIAQQANALAIANLADATTPEDTTNLEQSARDAIDALAAAQNDLAELEARVGTRVPAGEIIFVPALPATVTEVSGIPGGPPTEALATLSSAGTQVIAKLGRADSDLVARGARVTIDLRDTNLEVPGTVTSVGPPPGAADGAGRLQVDITADESDALTPYVSSQVKVVIEIASTGGAVLTVPIAAVSVGGSGASRVQVEKEPVSEGNAGSTDFVDVEVGLTAQGLVEIEPIHGVLHKGDRVVIGVTE